MKAKSFHSNRSSTANAARPARKTSAPPEASGREMTRGCTGISHSTACLFLKGITATGLKPVGGNRRAFGYGQPSLEEQVAREMCSTEADQAAGLIL